jgi:precorrin-6A/cobalt-precorrin-6A reductase
MKILILGGTGEARKLADELVARGMDVTTSLAGRTQAPLLPGGGVRVGGFGGAEGLAAYLGAEQFDVLVDATHPYAAQMSANAVAAAQTRGIRLLRLARPAWTPTGAVGWQSVADAATAADALPAGARALLSIGRSGLEPFLRRTDLDVLIRSIEVPEGPLPDTARLLQHRPPFTLVGERELLQEEAISHLVTKNSGGDQTRAKLDAAAELGVAIIMIDRPTLPAAPDVWSVAAALAALGLA